jgi:hypothetical protein
MILHHFQQTRHSALISATLLLAGKYWNKLSVVAIVVYEQQIFCEIWGFHSDEDSSSAFVGCDAV